MPAFAQRTEYATLICKTGIGQTPATEALGATYFSRFCLEVYKCEHSVAPQLASNQYVGGCTGCPQSAFAQAGGILGGCLITEN
jgi:hypothetical protein